MQLELYSERNQPAPARIQESFSHESWSNIIDLIKLFIRKNYFRDEFGDISNCLSYDKDSYFYLYIKANTNINLADQIIFKKSTNIITINVLDLIELLYCILRNEEKIINLYIRDINKNFYKHGMVYEIGSDGKILKKLPDELVELINQSNHFEFKDVELRNLISQACSKFKSHIIAERKISLEKLWDAFERIKTQLDSNKKNSVSKLISSLEVSSSFREHIEDEMNTLTKIGNSFQIRHSETDKTPITHHDEIDYLFHRCLSLLNLLATNLVRIQSQ